MVFAKTSATARLLSSLLLAAAVPASAASQPAESGWQPAPLEEALDLLDQRAPWRQWDPIEFPRHPAEKFLAGWTIVLDPGHGGDAHRPGFKRGPTGVREAEINWRVGVLLERLLSEAGVHVVMTRSGDYDVSLGDRAEIANNVVRPDGGVGADLFISLHHNATGNPETNYTSVWHHGEIDWSEPDIDVARYVAHALFRHLRTDAGLTSYLLSDQLMYPRGFGVLNSTRVPAILLETSFHTNPREEQRLRDAIYNLREAYAIYTGLCEYAYGGRPTQSKPELQIEDETVRLRFEIDDGLPRNWWGSDRNRTISSSIQLFLDDEPIASHYDPKTRIVTASLPLLPPATAEKENRHILRIHHANLASHHNWPQRYELVYNQAEGETALPGIRILGARRAGRNSEDTGQTSEETDPASGTTDREPKAPELGADAITRIQQAKPGDIVVLDELEAKQIPSLDVRLTAEPGPQLVFSDMPEYFRSGDGVALEETVRPGLIRLYLYHVPEPDGGPKVITAMIENLGRAPMNLRFHRYAFPAPGARYHEIAKTALIDFLGHAAGPPDRTIASGERVPVDSAMDATTVRDGQLVHGFYEFEIDQPARITSLQRDPGANSAEVMDDLPRLPRVLPDTHVSGAGRGRFERSNFLVTLPADKPLDTADGPRQLVVADGRRDPWVIGADSIEGDTVENKGNYGVVYRIRIKRTSSDGRSLGVFMHNLFPMNRACRTLAAAVRIGAVGASGEIVPVPRDQTAFSGPGGNVLLGVFPPLPEGKSETIEILYSPPGASCLPTPIFFVPF